MHRILFLFILAATLPSAARADDAVTNVSAQAFATVDSDHNGRVEWEEYLSHREGSLAARFQAIDRDRDGTITQAEFESAMRPSLVQRRLYQQQTGEELPVAPPFDSVDSDADGRLSRAEFLKAQQTTMRQRFTSLDTDADGTLSPAEFETARQRLLDALRERPSTLKSGT